MAQVYRDNLDSYFVDLKARDVTRQIAAATRLADQASETAMKHGLAVNHSVATWAVGLHRTADALR